MITFNKHIKWRVDRKDILICDCKKLTDLKLSKDYKKIMINFEKGIEKSKLTTKEKLLFLDFDKLNFFSTLRIKPLTTKTINEGISILDKELGTERVRSRDFLRKKFKANKRFFLGLFLDREIIGIICGFPREDYLLISELAVNSRFRRRGFGKRLVNEFEKIAKRYQHKKIHVGAQDSALNFYESLDYKSFLLIQFKEKDYPKEIFKKFNILNQRNINEGIILEVKINSPTANNLNKLRKKYPRAYFQYIFTKGLN